MSVNGNECGVDNRNICCKYGNLLPMVGVTFLKIIVTGNIAVGKTKALRETGDYRSHSHC
jgi:hypothetical protein